MHDWAYVIGLFIPLFVAHVVIPLFAAYVAIFLCLLLFLYIDTSFSLERTSFFYLFIYFNVKREESFILCYMS